MATFVITMIFLVVGFVLLFFAWVASGNAGDGARALLPAAICFGLTAWGISDLARAQSGNHGDGHAENHDWYQNLTQPDTGFPCCNGSTSSVEGDCRPTRAFLDEDGLWYALLDGLWVPIPPRVVLKQLAPDGHSHICASQSGLIYCFLAGSPKI